MPAVPKVRRYSPLRHVRVVNRSPWPDWFVRPVVAESCRRAGVPFKNRRGVVCPYVVEIGHTLFPSRWYGRGDHRGCWLTCSLRVRVPGRVHKDTRYKWSVPVPLASAREVFVFLVAHEISHATLSHPLKFRDPKSGRYNVASCEHRANSFGAEMVAWYRANRSALKGPVPSAPLSPESPCVNRPRVLRSFPGVTLVTG